MKKPPKGAIILRGTPSTDGKKIRVWCPFCHVLHCHGLDAEVKGENVSHRAAHCDESNPFKKQGYYVGLLPTSES